MSEYKLVPVEPTPEMLAAPLHQAAPQFENRMDLRPAIYRAMLSAAPDVQGELCGWFTEDHLTDKSATTYDSAVADRWRAKGWRVSPLYAAPQPVDQPSDRHLDAITGALASGKQGVSPPPTGHWLTPYWEMGNAEREQQSNDSARLKGICLFLDGQSGLEGLWWGDLPGDRPKFWWRKELREAVEPFLATASEPPVKRKAAPDVAGLVEALESARDDLSDWVASFEQDADLTATRKVLAKIDAALAAHRKQGESQ